MDLPERAGKISNPDRREFIRPCELLAFAPTVRPGCGWRYLVCGRSRIAGQPLRRRTAAVRSRRTLLRAMRGGEPLGVITVAQCGQASASASTSNACSGVTARSTLLLNRCGAVRRKSRFTRSQPLIAAIRHALFGAVNAPRAPGGQAARRCPRCRGESPSH